MSQFTPSIRPTSPAVPADRIDRSRAWINANAASVLVVAAAAILLAVFTVRSEFSKGQQPTYVAWYYDTVTGEYFEDKPNLLAPIQSPSGNEALRVYFFNCGDCDPSDPQLKMYEKYSPEAHALLADVLKGEMDEEQEAEMFDMIYENRLVSFDGVNWKLITMDSEDPEEELSRQCPQGDLVYSPRPY